MTLVFYLSLKISATNQLSSTSTKTDLKTGETHNSAISEASLLNLIFSQMNLEGNVHLKCLTLISNSMTDPIAKGKISRD